MGRLEAAQSRLEKQAEELGEDHTTQQEAVQQARQLHALETELKAR